MNVKKENGPLILAEGTRETTGVIRARDIRVDLAGKCDPAVRVVLEKIAELNHQNMLSIANLATSVDRIIDIVQQFADIAENMKTEAMQMKRATEQMQRASEGDENS